MVFDFIFFDKMETIVSTLDEFVSNFVPVFTTVDMKNELFFGKYVVGIERTFCFFFVLPESEHSSQK